MPAPRPAAPHPLARALAALAPGAGSATADGLTVYPLHGPAAEGPVPLSLAAALADRKATVREAGIGARTVLVSSAHRERPLLLLAGEVLQGGRGDRMVARDTLVHAGARDLPVPVLPVEVGRAPMHRASRFAASPGIAGARLRSLALAQAPVDEMADAIRRDLSVLGVAGLERSLADAFHERGPAGPFLRAAGRRVDELLRALRDPRTTGFAVAHGRELLGVETFAGPELLHAHARRLLLGYAVEAGTRRGGGTAPGADAVAALLADASRGAFFSGEGPGGATTEWGVVTEAGLLGSAVASGEGVLHAAVFGAAATRRDLGASRGGRDGSPQAPGTPGAPEGGSSSTGGGADGGGSGDGGGDGTTTGGEPAPGGGPEPSPVDKPR